MCKSAPYMHVPCIFLCARAVSSLPLLAATAGKERDKDAGERCDEARAPTKRHERISGILALHIAQNAVCICTLPLLTAIAFFSELQCIACGGKRVEESWRWRHSWTHASAGLCQGLAGMVSIATRIGLSFTVCLPLSFMSFFHGLLALVCFTFVCYSVLALFIAFPLCVFIACFHDLYFIVCSLGLFCITCVYSLFAWLFVHRLFFTVCFHSLFSVFRSVFA